MNDHGLLQTLIGIIFEEFWCRLLFLTEFRQEKLILELEAHSWPRGYDQKFFHVQFMGFKYSLIYRTRATITRSWLKTALD